MDKPFKTYKLQIAYDGTVYHGWQVQPNSTTIQGCLQKALLTITRNSLSLIGAGRTDAGVHAIGQVAHFKSPVELNCQKVLFSLNGLLPKDIRILKMEEAPADFHAQYSALSKTYRYHLCPGKVQNPLRRFFALHVFEKLDLDLLKEGATYFIGTHDFTSFANRATEGSAAKGAVRHLYRLDIYEQEGEIVLEFEANGFLYKMVRNMVGTLLEVASKKRLPSDIPALFAAKDRRQAAKAAAPHGLCLMEINYEEPKNSVLDDSFHMAAPLTLDAYR